MGFGKVVRAAKASTPLLDLISARFRQDEAQPPLTPESYVRCSGLSSMCTREEVLCAINGIERRKVVEADLNLIFSHGTALHHILQNRVLPSLVDVLHGNWKCLKCGKLHTGPEDKPMLEAVILRPKACGCGGVEFSYEELPLLSNQYRLTGHPDGFLKLPQYEGFGILEAKSISNRGAWEVKKTPKMDHVIQSQMYMWFTGTQWSQILYWDKGTNGLAGLIEHHVERDDDVIQDILASIEGLWSSLGAWHQSKEKRLPERICATNDCPRANVCSVAKLCFSEPA